MNSQKAGNTLNLALDATFREREASMNLNVGYEKETQRWNLIIRYFGEASELETDGILSRRFLEIMGSQIFRKIESKDLHKSCSRVYRSAETTVFCRV